MCLAYNARLPTLDVDALFAPTAEVRKAAVRAAHRAGVSPDWLDDGVKGYLSAQGEFEPFLEFTRLHVMVAQPDYMLAMKCLAMRIGEEFHDEDDIRYLLRHLGIRDFDKAIEVISRYYPLERFPQKTLYALGDLLPSNGSS
jgi:hypothetical protein